MPPRLFLLRHGRSVANARGLIASSPTNAGDAFGLTPVGREQVRRTIVRAQAAGTLDSPFLLVSSPLLRARESIDVVADVLGSVPTVDARLSERNFGIFELEPDDRYERVWAEDRLDATHRSWGVESVVQVLERARPVMEELAQNERAATVILCTHGDVASILRQDDLTAECCVPACTHRGLGGRDVPAHPHVRCRTPCWRPRVRARRIKVDDEGWPSVVLRCQARS